MRALFAFVLLSGPLLCVPSTVTAAPPALDQQALVGTYSLQDAHEMGSGLELRKDGTFRWSMSYGNQDLQSAGAWDIKGQRIVLTSKRQPLKFRLFTDAELNLKKNPKAGVWVAIIGVPRYGPVADVEVKFEAKSGKTATATSQPNGDAIVDMPASETWTRAGLRAKETGDYTWVAVPPARGASRIAAFAVTNVDALQNGFATMELEQKGGDLVVVGDNAVPGRYVRRPSHID